MFGKRSFEVESARRLGGSVGRVVGSEGSARAGVGRDVVSHGCGIGSSRKAVVVLCGCGMHDEVPDVALADARVDRTDKRERPE